MTERERTPVTVVTGFLGAGKTTLLAHLLGTNAAQTKSGRDLAKHGRRIAVIENEFGGPQVGLQHDVPYANLSALQSAAMAAEISETANGCLCCSGKGDFLRILAALLQRRDEFDYIIVETTGLADPTFASAFFTQEFLEDNLELDGIVAVVDALRIEKQLDAKPPIARTERGIETVNEAHQQIAFADRIIVNKADTVSKDQIERVIERVRAINPTAAIQTAEYSQVEADSVLGIKAFDMERILKHDPGFLGVRPFRQHDESTTAFTLLASPGEVASLDVFEKWLRSYLDRNKGQVFRTKAVVAVRGDPHRYVVQGVQDDFVSMPHAKWEGDPIISSRPRDNSEGPVERYIRVSFIGQSLDSRECLLDFERATGLRPKMEIAPQDKVDAPSGLMILMLLGLTSLLLFPDEAWDVVKTREGATIIGAAFILYMVYRLYFAAPQVSKQ